MTFFYDMNKKLQQVLETPKSEHMQLNERDEGKPGKNFAKIAKDAGERYGSKAAGERVAGAVRNKLRAQGKLEEGDMDESAFQAAIGKKKYGADGMKALQKAGREHASDKTMSNIRNKYDKYDEGVMDTIKSVGKKVAGGINKLVGHGSDEEMIRDLQRKSGAPVTGKKPTPPQQVKEKMSPAKQKSFAALAPPKDKITFADKIAGAKKEVDEMLGDVAADAMRKAIGKSSEQRAQQADDDFVNDHAARARNQRRHDDEEKWARSKGRNPNADMDESNAFDYKSPRGMQKGEKKASSTGGEIHQKDEKTVVHTAGRHYGGADEPDPKKEKQSRSGAPVKHDKPRQERVTAKSRKADRTAHGQAGFKKTNEGDMDPADQGEYDQEGDMAKNDIKTIVRHAEALNKILGDNDNLPEWVQSKLAKIEGMMVSIDEYMQNEKSDSEEGEGQELDEKAVSKQQQKFMGMAHAMQKGKKIPGASKELKKVAKTMKPSDTHDFAATKHKGLPEKVKSKKKEEEVEESSTTSGSVAPSTASGGGKGSVFGKGIYDSMNRELEKMIAESMSVNMSDSTEGGKSLTITATDEDALKLGMLLKNAGLGGGEEMHSHGEEPCPTCGMEDCGCGDVHQEVDENAPDWPTNTETNDDALQYAGGLNKPKTDVAGDGQTTIPNTAVHTQDEDALRRMMEMAGIRQADLEPWKETMKEEAVEEAAKPDFLDLDKDGNKEESMKDAAKDKEEDIEESLQRMREMAGIKEAKKPDYLDFDKDGDKKEPMTKAIKDKEKKVEESIFTLTNQWRAYKG